MAEDSKNDLDFNISSDGVIRLGPKIDLEIPPYRSSYEDSDIPLVREIASPGAVNFAIISEKIDKHDFSDEEMQDLTGAVVEKVANTFFSGHFRDLRGSKELLNRLGVSVELPEDLIKDLKEILPRVDQASLSRLGVSQPPEQGKYNIEGARRILKNAGFADEELTNDRVTRILDIRHVLMLLKGENESEKVLVRESFPRLSAPELK